MLSISLRLLRSGAFMKSKSIAIWTALFLLALVGSANAETATIQTEGGPLQGRHPESVFVFKGIPYAAPPILDRRWKEPAGAEPWKGVRSADAFGPACIQP